MRESGIYCSSLIATSVLVEMSFIRMENGSIGYSSDMATVGRTTENTLQRNKRVRVEWIGVRFLFRIKNCNACPSCLHALDVTTLQRTYLFYVSKRRQRPILSCASTTHNHDERLGVQKLRSFLGCRKFTMLSRRTPNHVDALRAFRCLDGTELIIPCDSGVEVDPFSTSRHLSSSERETAEIEVTLDHPRTSRRWEPRDAKTLSTTSTGTPTRSSHSGSEGQKRKTFRDRFMKPKEHTVTALSLASTARHGKVTTSPQYVQVRRQQPLTTSRGRSPDKQQQQRRFINNLSALPTSSLLDLDDKRRTRSLSRKRILGPILCTKKAVDLEYHLAVKENRYHGMTYVAPSAIPALVHRPGILEDDASEQRHPQQRQEPQDPDAPRPPSIQRLRNKEPLLDRKPSSIHMQRHASGVSELSDPRLEREHSTASVATLRDALKQVEVDIKSGKKVSREELLETLKAVDRKLQLREKQGGTGNSKKPNGIRHTALLDDDDDDDNEESEDDGSGLMEKGGASDLAGDNISLGEVSEFTRWLDDLEEDSAPANGGSNFLYDMFMGLSSAPKKKESTTQIEPPPRRRNHGHPKRKPPQPRLGDISSASSPSTVERMPRRTYQRESSGESSAEQHPARLTPQGFEYAPFRPKYDSPPRRHPQVYQTFRESQASRQQRYAAYGHAQVDQKNSGRVTTSLDDVLSLSSIESAQYRGRNPTERRGAHREKYDSDDEWDNDVDPSWVRRRSNSAGPPYARRKRDAEGRFEC